MPEKVNDPVCGMQIDKEKAKGPVDHMGKLFYFCSESCQRKFEKEPMKYMEK